MRDHHLLEAPEEDQNEINLTPMLDVVFIMLIFFIVTASFIKEAGLDVNRPDAPVTETQPEKANILVAIDQNDDIWIERRIIEDCLRRNNHRRKETAAELGISRVTLYNKMKKFGLMD